MNDNGLTGALTSTLAERAWREVVDWTQSQAERRYRSLCDRQAELVAWASDLLDDQSDQVFGLAADLLLTIDRAYELATGSLGPPIGAEIVAAAASWAEERFGAAQPTPPETTIGSEELAAPDMAITLVDIADAATAAADPVFDEKASGALFFLIYVAVRSFECSHGIAPSAPQSSQAPVPAAVKVGRNAPCPCGSGRKFKRCCGQDQQAATEDHSPTAEQLRLADYIACAEQILSFAEGDLSSDGVWLAKYVATVGERYEHHEAWDVLEPALLGHALLDVELPRSRVSMATLFRRARGRGLDAKVRRLLRELGESYLAFYELTGSAAGRLTFRELVSGDCWRGCDADAPADFEFESGEFWLCRFLGGRDDAVAFGQPLVFEPEAAAEVELAAATIFDEIRAAAPDNAGLSFAETMKKGGEELLSYIALSAPDDDGAEYDEEDREDIEEGSERPLRSGAKEIQRGEEEGDGD